MTDDGKMEMSYTDIDSAVSALDAPHIPTPIPIPIPNAEQNGNQGYHTGQNCQDETPEAREVRLKQLELIKSGAAITEMSEAESLEARIAKIKERLESRDDVHKLLAREYLQYLTHSNIPIIEAILPEGVQPESADPDTIPHRTPFIPTFAIRESYRNGNTARLLYFKKDRLEGPQFVCNEEGKTIRVTEFREGTPNGKDKESYPNGTLKRLADMKDGLVQGKQWELYEDKTPKRTSEWVDGVQNGEERTWHEGGYGIATEMTYANGEPHGNYKRFYPRSDPNDNIQKVLAKGQYEEGELHGDQTILHQNHRIATIETYDYGVLTKRQMYDCTNPDKITKFTQEFGPSGDATKTTMEVVDKMPDNYDKR